MYVGDADSVEVDVYSATGTPPRDLAVAAIDPGAAPTDATVSRTAAKTGGTSTTTTPDGLPRMPAIVTRRQWGADESLGDQCWPPRYGRTFNVVFVHHTAGSNSYTRRESASIVRGIYAYHTQSRDWCDIGYNFLVDRYGTVYEGRAGGIRKAVRGAHAGDYNVNSTGISLMGEFTNVFPPKAMRRSLVKLVAWRLGVAYHGGYGRARINGKVFNRISGHRDAMSTSCPGQQVYDWLPTAASQGQRPTRPLQLADQATLAQDRGSQRLPRPGTDRRGRGRAVVVTRRSPTPAPIFKDGRRRTIKVGPFLNAYLATGEVRGRLGYPVSGVSTPRRGYSARFEGGSLFWSPKSGGQALVTSKILTRYRHLEGPSGKLGYPETQVRRTPDGSVARFRFGTIRYDKQTQRTTVSYR